MERKAALIGCREGPWIRTRGMRGLHVNLRVHRDATVIVEQRDTDSIDEEPQRHTFVGARIERIKDACWTRVRVADGPYIDALCLLQARS